MAPLSELSSSSWFGLSDEERLSLKEFNDSIHPYVMAIANMQSVLLEARVPFETGDALPFHCRQAISMLIELNKQMGQCCHLLRETSTLPVIMMALRYRLLEELHYLEELTDKLIDCISGFCSSCMTSSQSTIRQGQAIDKLFETLLRHIIDLPQKARFLVHEAHFQEERLTSIIT
jgi:hypothetical protein